MSNKLTALTAATLPLAGTEAVYVVQGGNSRQTTAAAVIASCSIIANNETITGTKTYNSGKLQLAGSTSGVTILNATAAASGTLTLPAATDTLVGRATTDTLTNKTISGASNTITNVSLTTGVTGTLPIANGGTNAPDVGTARLNFTLPVYTTYANLPNLDTTKDAVAFVTDRTREGQWVWNSGDQSARTVIQSETTTSITGNVITLANHGLSTGAGIVTTTAVNGLSVNTVYWVINLSSSTFSLATTVENAIGGTVLTLTGTTNFTLKQLRDPLQDIYVPSAGGQLDGTTGVWSVRQGELDIGISRVNFQRFNDRVLIGQGATRWMGDHSGTTSSSAAGSWLLDETTTNSTFNMGYLLIGAQLASVRNPVSGFPPGGVLGATRTQDGADSGTGYIGVSGYFSGHATSGASVGWGGYLQADKRSGSNSTAQGLELEVANQNSTPTSPVVRSNASYVQGRTYGIFMASGAGYNSADVFDADAAFWVGSNPAKFRTGIVFSSSGLTQDASTNYQHAIILPPKARVEWDTSDGLGNYAFAIHSEISTAANAMFIRATDANLFLNNNNGGLAFRVQMNTNSGGNYVSLNATNPGAGPTIQALGGDANIDLNLTTTGTGAVKSAAAILSSGTGGIGYATGAGGTVTQATSRTTGVTLNKVSGAITMFTAAGSATPASFTVTNSTVAATDTVVLNIKSGASNTYFLFVTAVAAGSFVVTFWTTGGTTSDTPVINFNVLKGVAA